MPDAHKNFAYSTVATAPSPATTGTSLVVAAGDGAKFPTPPFNATVWPASSQPTTANAEIVRVTAIATDTLTITRVQEGTTARSVVVGDQISATITVKTLTDVEAYPASHYTLEDDFVAGGANTTNWGDLGSWNANGGSLTLVVAVAGHPGIYRRDTGTTAGTYASSMLGSTSTLHSDNDFDMTWIVRVNQIDADTALQLGMGDDMGHSFGNNSLGIYLERLGADTNWFGVCRSANTQTRVDLGVAASTNWVRLRIRKVGSTVYFSANGGTEQSISTNIPSSAVRIGWNITNGVAAASKTADIDYWGVSITGLAR